MIRRILFTTVIAASMMPALGAEAPKKVQRAAEKIYPDKTVTVEPYREMNGTPTFEAVIENRKGDVKNMTVITENGDVVMSSQRRTDGAPTPAVERVAKDLFNMPMDDYESVEQTFYFISTDLDGRAYQMKIDATGRIRDVQTERDLRLSDISGYEKASGADRDAVIGFVNKWHDNAKVGEAYQYQPIPGYYLVQYTTGDGDPGEIILNRGGRVYQELTGIKEAALPKQVREAISESVKGAKIQSVMRGDLRYYEFERPAGDGTLRLRIRPNGEIVQVLNQPTGEEDRAVTAGERQPREE